MYVCLSVLAHSGLQILLDRLGRCLKRFVSADSISCHKFASQFGLALFDMRKSPKNYREGADSRKVLLNERCLGRIHTGSSTVPDSSEPYASGRLRVGFAFTLQTTDPPRTVRAHFAVYTLRLLRDRLLPNYMYLIHDICHPSWSCGNCISGNK